MKAKWREQSKQGKVILHGMYGNSDVLPTPSPFVLKLETYLRLTKIPYEVDKVDFWGPKGKTPWISYEGEHLADSQFITEFLSRKFGKQLANKYSIKERAIGTMTRVMVEEHLYWAGVMWRFAFGGKDTFQKVLRGEKSFIQWLIFRLIAPQMRSSAWSQGVGRHNETEIKAIMLNDLRAISTVLGQNKFLLGEEPCEDDCSVFAGLASAVFSTNSPLEKELNDELSNLKEYCYRMKDLLWPDWESHMNKLKQN
ncbi:hypothetical protein Ocin01_00866 [Orchesella cincta]|uniref:Failed axon connections n=1 Tax=Orchesella cincta TaxID=48709 RepID=A0A1D2NKT2_ORCCI|nr:hypothetical protein Ocin01_00866 [Orchesella cincta]